jgi:hypothetical protein
MLYDRDLLTKYEAQENQKRISPAARQLSRRRMKADVHISWGEAVAVGSTENISPKGAYIRTAASIPTDLILIELFPPHEPRPSIMLSAMVIRRDENGIGVEFSTITLETAAELQAFLELLSSRTG